MFNFQILFCTFMAAQNIALCHPHLETFSSARGAATALFRLVSRASRLPPARPGLRPRIVGDITLRDVYFNYPSRPDVKVRARLIRNPL